jgi:hypothetical protein
MALKIYRMNDVIEWVAANSLEEAKSFYVKWCLDCGMDIHEVDYEDAKEEDKIDTLMYEDEDFGGRGKCKTTFREQLELGGQDEPYFFASTEY